MHLIEACLAKKRDNFLLLRIIAAVMVIYGHSFSLARDIGTTDIFLRYNWKIYSGSIAVNMFFVISGFMVSGSYLSRTSLPIYIIARLLRIVPAYLFILLASALVIGPLFTDRSISVYFSNPDVVNYVIKNLHFSSDMAWTLPGVFDGGARMTAINGALWTLPAEMRMYVLVAMLGVFGLLKNRVFGSIIIAGLFAAGLLRPQLLPLHPEWLWLGVSFLVGILAQLYKDRIEIRHDIMLALIVLTYICNNTDSYPLLFRLTNGYFCFWFAYRLPILRLEKNGDPSYGIYLWGWPVQQMVVALSPNITPLFNCLISIEIAVFMGYISWHLVERPALSLKKMISRVRERPLVVCIFPQQRTDQ